MRARRPSSGRVARAAQAACGVAAALVLAVLTTTCAPAGRTRAQVEHIAQARRVARGAWITFVYQHGWGRYRSETRPAYDGELLAVGRDTIYVLARSGMVAVPTSILREAGVRLYEAPSAPVGDPALSLYPSRKDRWKRLVPYARFPQGMPAGFAPAPTAAASATPHGAWITLTYKATPGRRWGGRALESRQAYEGELLAAGRDTIHVLTRSGMVAIPTSILHEAHTRLYEAPARTSGDPILSLNPGGRGPGARSSWERLARYARFPLGLPAGFVPLPTDSGNTAPDDP